MRDLNPKEYKVVALRDCPVPQQMQICEEPKQVADYWRMHIATHPYFNPDCECFVVLLLNMRRRVSDTTTLRTDPSTISAKFKSNIYTSVFLISFLLLLTDDRFLILNHRNAGIPSEDYSTIGQMKTSTNRKTFNLYAPIWSCVALVVIVFITGCNTAVESIKVDPTKCPNSPTGSFGSDSKKFFWIPNPHHGDSAGLAYFLPMGKVHINAVRVDNIVTNYVLVPRTFVENGKQYIVTNMDTDVQLVTDSWTRVTSITNYTIVTFPPTLIYSNITTGTNFYIGPVTTNTSLKFVATNTLGATPPGGTSPDKTKKDQNPQVANRPVETLTFTIEPNSLNSVAGSTNQTITYSNQPAFLSPYESTYSVKNVTTIITEQPFVYTNSTYSITVSVDYQADRNNLFLLQPQMDGFHDDSTTFTIDNNGLLSSIGTTNTDQTGSVVVQLVEAAAQSFEMVASGGLSVPSSSTTANPVGQYNTFEQKPIPATNEYILQSTDITKDPFTLASDLAAGKQKPPSSKVLSQTMADVEAINQWNIDYAVLSVGDIANWQSLATKLQSQTDRVSAYLHTRMKAETQRELTNYKSLGIPVDSLQKALVEDLNKIIKGSPIYDPNRFANVVLSPQTQALLVTNPKGPMLKRLNRLLLEDAYPGEISRDWDASSTTIDGEMCTNPDDIYPIAQTHITGILNYALTNETVSLTELQNNGITTSEASSFISSLLDPKRIHTSLRQPYWLTNASPPQVSRLKGLLNRTLLEDWLGNTDPFPVKPIDWLATINDIFFPPAPPLPQYINISFNPFKRQELASAVAALKNAQIYLENSADFDETNNTLFQKWETAPSVGTSGIFYRPPVPYEIRLRDRASNVVSTIVLLPNKSPILHLELNKAPFVSAISDVTLTNGFITSYSFSKPSSFNAMAAIPLTILSGITSSITNLIQLRINLANSQNSLQSAQYAGQSNQYSAYLAQQSAQLTALSNSMAIYMATQAYKQMTNNHVAK